jgi:hypothetical protein
MGNYADRDARSQGLTTGGSAVQRMPGKQTLVEACTPVQAIQSPGAPATDADTVHSRAQEGIAGSGGALPHQGQIQAAFGHHDVGGISAHVGGPAASAANAIGASAYATGNAVAFRETPDLHTAAHEAAHVVQQRGGVQLKGGVGETDDPYERHADAVADRVVRGESAAGLLDAGAGGGSASGAAVQRKWNATAESEIAKLPKDLATAKVPYETLHGQLAQYDKIPDADLKPTDLELLPKITQQIVTIVETSGVDSKVQAELRAVAAQVRLEEDRARYVMQHAATQDKFKTGVPRYLNVTPTPGTSEALSTGSTGKYDSSIPVAEQYRVGVPEDEQQDLDIAVDGGGGVMDLLVVSGGHGGVGAMFETKGGGHFSEDWWAKQVNILAGKNVSAKLIVLDACLTASVAHAFVPLLAPHGKIIGYVHSIPQMVMTDQIWKEVHDQGGKTVEEVIDARVAEVTKEHASSRHDTPLAATVAVAVYQADRGYLRHDEQALSQTTIAALTNPTEQNELSAMSRRLTHGGAKPVTDYVPGLAKEGGTEVVAVGTQTVALAELRSGWFDDTVSKLDQAATPEPDDDLYDPTYVMWTVVAVKGDQVELKKA